MLYKEELILLKWFLLLLFKFPVNDYCHLPLCNVLRAGTDVMLLDNFSTDGSSHPQHHGNLSGKRRSSVTFEDQVEHSKGMCRLPAPQQITEKGVCFTLGLENDFVVGLYHMSFFFFFTFKSSIEVFKCLLPYLCHHPRKIKNIEKNP